MEKTVERKFWTDFFIASAVCFADVIIFRLLFLLVGTIPLWVITLVAAAILIPEAVVFTKRTGRTVMFPLASMVFQLLNMITYAIYVWCLLDGLTTSEKDSGFIQFLVAIAGVFLVFAFLVIVVFIAMWCTGVFVVTFVTSLITKAVMDKKAKAEAALQIEMKDETPSETTEEV